MSRPTPYRPLPTESSAGTSGPTIAVLGASHWHMERQVASFQSAGARFVGVFDSQPSVSSRWAEALDVPAHRSKADVLDAGADLVLIMTPHDQVAGDVADAVRREQPYVVEKPAGVDAATLWPVVEETERRNVFGVVAFVNRFSDFWASVAEIRAAGKLQHPVRGRFRIVNGSPHRYADDDSGWMLDRARAGGGPMRNLGSHTVDAVRLLADGPWTVTGASTSHAGHGLSIEDHTVAVLHGPDGQSVTVEAGYCYPQRDLTDHEWFIAGIDAEISETVDELVIRTEDETIRRSAPSMAERYDRFAQAVVDAWTTQAPSPVPIRAAAEALTMIDAIYACANTPAHPALAAL